MKTSIILLTLLAIILATLIGFRIFLNSAQAEEYITDATEVYYTLYEDRLTISYIFE